MPLNGIQPVSSPASLEQLAYDAIKDAVLAFRFKPGESLVEADLAGQLKISKTPVREALSRLEREGFIVKLPYKGYYVSEISHKEMVDIFEMRAALEGLAVREAAERMTAEDITQAVALVEQHARAVEACDIPLASSANRDFHNFLIERSGNRRLALVLNNLNEHLQRYRVLSSFQAGRLKKSDEEHHRILAALLASAPAAAETAAREHILSVSAGLAAQNFDELLESATKTEFKSSDDANFHE